MSKSEVILMGHGGGGKLTREIIDDLILRYLRNPILEQLDDAACIDMPGGDLVLTTDSYVVDPIFFPGGDIGKLAVCGTTNDLAMQGGEPRYLTLGLIIEEGLELTSLEKILISIRDSSLALNVPIVTGDTKVIDRRGGRAREPGMFINTTGIGIKPEGVNVSVCNARPGDVVIVSGSIADHGVAIMNEREKLGLESCLESDVAALWPMISKILDTRLEVRSLRDPTRGGVAAALSDMAGASGVGIRITETEIPVRKNVMAACNILGLDPLNVANEGKALVICAEKTAFDVLGILQNTGLGAEARAMGVVTAERPGMVVMETMLGGERIVDVPAGEQLPRIC